MYSKLRLKLKADGLDYKKSSALQGVFFENIDQDYAEFLHRQQMHPYSQSLTAENRELVWEINALTDECREKTIDHLEKNIAGGFRIKSGKIDVEVTDKSVLSLTDADLMEEFNSDNSSKTIDFKILTPMAFKQNGRYVVMPDVRLMFQSIMNRYSMASDSMDMIDEETLEQLSLNSAFTKFNVRSIVFPMEGVNIPGAVGNLRIKINGSAVMARYARLLMRFAQYSGIGIKTSAGMGAVRLEEK